MKNLILVIFLFWPLGAIADNDQPKPKKTATSAQTSSADTKPPLDNLGADDCKNTDIPWRPIWCQECDEPPTLGKMPSGGQYYCLEDGYHCTFFCGRPRWKMIDAKRPTK